MSEPLQVSDWSQKWKIGLYLVGLALFAYFGFRVIGVLGDKPLGVSFQEPSFGVASVTSTQVSCNTTTTLLLATSTGRSSFIAANVGASITYLCRSAGLCSSTSGIPIYPAGSTTNTLSVFVQQDGYAGPYRCQAGAVNLLNIRYSN